MFKYKLTILARSPSVRREELLWSKNFMHFADIVECLHKQEIPFNMSGLTIIDVSIKYDENGW